VGQLAHLTTPLLAAVEEVVLVVIKMAQVVNPVAMVVNPAKQDQRTSMAKVAAAAPMNIPADPADLADFPE
jgi:hypothetical protein